jgi:deazaflavin-dependent oxidoreductase (nitroreductase family)
MRSSKEITVKPPNLILRILFRLPLVLYRIGLGNLMGMQILLTTKGRRTGRPHKVAVDIIKQDKTKDTYYINAAFGPRSDWVLNLRVTPIVEAQICQRKLTVQTTVLPLGEAEEILVDFTRRHPRYVRIMMRVVGIRLGWSEDDVRALAPKMPVIACEVIRG